MIKFQVHWAEICTVWMSGYPKSFWHPHLSISFQTEVNISELRSEWQNYSPDFSFLFHFCLCYICLPGFNTAWKKVPVNCEAKRARSGRKTEEKKKDFEWTVFLLLTQSVVLCGQCCQLYCSITTLVAYIFSNFGTYAAHTRYNHILSWLTLTVVDHCSLLWRFHTK